MDIRRIVIISSIVIVLFLAANLILNLAGYVNVLNPLAEDPVVELNITIRDESGIPVFENVAIKQMSMQRIKVPKSEEGFFPGIHARVQQGATPVTDWSSAPYSGSGTYKLILSYISPPVKNESLWIYIKVVDSQGEKLNRIRYDYTVE